MLTTITISWQISTEVVQWLLHVCLWWRLFANEGSSTVKRNRRNGWQTYL